MKLDIWYVYAGCSHGFLPFYIAVWIPCGYFIFKFWSQTERIAQVNAGKSHATRWNQSTILVWSGPWSEKGPHCVLHFYIGFVADVAFLLLFICMQPPLWISKAFGSTISKPIVQIWNQCDFMQVPSSMSVHYKHICKNHFGETLSFLHRNTLAIPHIRFHFGRILAVLVDSLQNGVMPQVVLPCRVRIPGSAWMSAQLNHHSKLLFGKILVFAVFFCEFIC